MTTASGNCCDEGAAPGRPRAPAPDRARRRHLRLGARAERLRVPGRVRVAAQRAPARRAAGAGDRGHGRHRPRPRHARRAARHPVVALGGARPRAGRPAQRGGERLRPLPLPGVVLRLERGDGEGGGHLLPPGGPAAPLVARGRSARGLPGRRRRRRPGRAGRARPDRPRRGARSPVLDLRDAAGRGAVPGRRPSLLPRRLPGATRGNRRLHGEPRLGPAPLLPGLRRADRRHRRGAAVRDRGRFGARWSPGRRPAARPARSGARSR